MKKQYLILIILFWISQVVFGQVGISTNAENPDASAMLDVKSTIKGILIPRMTTQEKLEITAPAEGLLVYDTNLGSFFYYHSGSWISVLNAATGWSLNGNSGTDPSAQFLGTTDTARLMFKVNNYRAGMITRGGLTFFGYEAGLYNNSLGNTFIGQQAGLLTNSGSWNTALGYQALWWNHTGSFNTSIGVYSLQNNYNGHNNVGVGHQALYMDTSGYYNVAVGNLALNNMTSGHGNTAVGNYALLSNQTGSNNTVIGNSADVTSGDLSNSIAIGYGAYVNASNKAIIGNANVQTIGGYGDWTNYSDRRLKEDIRYQDELGLDFIMKLRPVCYNYVADSSKRRRDGLIAQDVQNAMQELGVEFSGLIIDDDQDNTMNLSYGAFVMPLINAVREQQQTIQNLQEEIKILKSEIKEMGH